MNNPPIDPWLIELNRLLKENDSLYRSATRQLGVPECTFWILYSLRAEGHPLTQTQLCQLIHQPKQTVNSALKSLESDGYITLSPGGDRRTREIVLTEKGVSLAECTADKIVQAEEQALAGLEPEEREALLRTYQRFNDLLRQSMAQMLKQINHNE